MSNATARSARTKRAWFSLSVRSRSGRVWPSLRTHSWTPGSPPPTRGPVQALRRRVVRRLARDQVEADLGRVARVLAAARALCPGNAHPPPQAAEAQELHQRAEPNPGGGKP